MLARHLVAARFAVVLLAIAGVFGGSSRALHVERIAADTAAEITAARGTASAPTSAPRSTSSRAPARAVAFLRSEGRAAAATVDRSPCGSWPQARDARHLLALKRSRLI